MKIYFMLAPLLVLLSPYPIYAKHNADVCRVTASTWSVIDKIGTGISELGTFPVKVSDDRTTKSFTYQAYEAGLVVTVGIEYGDTQAVGKGKPTNILLVMVVSDKEQDPFDFLAFPNNVEVGTTYGHRWGSIYVKKQVALGQLVHTFTLTCNDGSKSKKR
jgi:hypothetical protein